MEAAVVLDRLGDIVLVVPGRPPRSFPSLAAATASGPNIPAALERAIRDLPPEGPLHADAPSTARTLGEALGRNVPLASVE